MKNNLQRALYEFLSKNVKNNDELTQIIKDNDLLYLFSNQLDDKGDYYDFLKKQRERYDCFVKEIKLLNEKARKKGITLLVLKGIVLADDLYEPYYARESLDIDLLVDETELEKMVNILIENGYYIENDNYTNSLGYVLKYKSIRDELTHITQYHKKQSEKSDVMIDIDLHIRPFHFMPLMEKNSDNSLFSKSIEYKIKAYDNYSIRTTNHIDTFIHLSAHLLRHYYWQFFRALRGEEKFYSLGLRTFFLDSSYMLIQDFSI